MTRTLWSINGLATELQRDRRTVADALSGARADGEIRGRPAWFMTTAIAALGGAAGELDPVQERARKDRALAIATEIKNDLACGELVLVDDVVREVTGQFGILRSQLLAIPSRVASQVPADQRDLVLRLVEGRLHEAMAEISESRDLRTVKAARTKQAARRKAEDHHGEPDSGSPAGSGCGPRRRRAERGGAANHA
ncbi:hypothetical protein [Methylobacterium sp. A54F]